MTQYDEELTHMKAEIQQEADRFQMYLHPSPDDFVNHVEQLMHQCAQPGNPVLALGMHNDPHFMQVVIDAFDAFAAYQRVDNPDCLGWGPFDANHFTPELATAVWHFQESSHVEATGQVDAPTWQAFALHLAGTMEGVAGRWYEIRTHLDEFPEQSVAGHGHH